MQPKVSKIKISPNELANLPDLKLQDSIPSYHSFLGDNHFRFLNIEQPFLNQIDWNFADHGKLWTYNLNYFEFLEQPDLDKNTGLRLIRDFIENEANLKDGLEPFPISLRTIFWIKFLVKHQIRDSKIDAALLRHLKLLTHQIEYHLLGNHLLENGFALLFGAYYFSNNEFSTLAEKILNEQLSEQILEDGAHFERSPMYHSLMLFRVLDCANLVENNSHIFQPERHQFLKEKAAKMLGWLKQIQFSDGSLPRVKDSAAGIAPTPEQLFEYALKLNISPVFKGKTLGYRQKRSKTYECFVDIGGITPDYQPGHAHADIFNFILHHRGKPLLVDTGISTYEKDSRRTAERSTAAHNTVQIGDENQSDVWGGFRVGRRAQVISIEETSTSIKVAHDGYQERRIIHERSFDFSKKSGLKIIDKLNKKASAKAFFHFHPNVSVELKNDRLIGEFGDLIFENFEKITLEKYDYAHGFNKTELAVLATVIFTKELNTKIHLL